MRADEASARLCYVHDPMCSWCWAARPALDRLIDRLPPELPLRRVLGGLAPDSDEPMPTELRHRLEATWRRIEAVVPGTRFDFAFWRDNVPRRSTFRACRAVIAAREQSPALETPMIDAIQRAYYLAARNPSDRDVLIDLATELGCEVGRFSADLDDARLHAVLAGERRLAATLGVSGFPSLVLVTEETDGSQRGYSIPIDYHDPDTMLTRLERLLHT